MSAIFFYILFCICLLNLTKPLKMANAAHMKYNDYNYLDTADKDLSKYLESFQGNKKAKPFKTSFEYNGKIDKNEPNYIEDNDLSECEPLPEITTQTTTTFSPPQEDSSTAHGPATTITPKPDHNFVTPVNEAQDIIDHVTHLIKSMREHAIALIKNMNELETDILSSNSTDIDNLMGIRNATHSEDGSTMYGMKKMTYREVSSQKPNYVNDKWSASISTDKIPKTQTNEFMEEAQEAVRSWKREIENCKRILDSAINKDLESSNLKSNLITEAIDKSSLKSSDHDGLVYGQRKHVTRSHNVPARELKQMEKLKKDPSNGRWKYDGKYDALHYKNRG